MDSGQNGMGAVGGQLAAGAIFEKMVSVSVAICTFNRAPVLAGTLDSFAQRHGACAYPHELLLVDNNSTDRTREVVDAFGQAHPDIPLRYLLEARQGLSHARNRAIEEARGSIVVYCDDDVFFDSNVVDSYAAVFEAAAETIAVCGRIDPHFDAPRPAWLSDKWLRYYGISQMGDAARPLQASETPIGASMAIRREALRSVGGFSAALGRDGKTLLSNEEILLFDKLRAHGGRIVYAPQARIRHRIPAARLSQDWLAERVYWQGVSDAALEAEDSGYSRMGALLGAWADLWSVIKRLRPTTWSPAKIYWQFRRPGIATRNRLAYGWGRARRRLKNAFALRRG